METIRVSFRETHLPNPLKNAIDGPILKKPSHNPEDLSNYLPVTHLPFLGKITEQVVIIKLQQHATSAMNLDVSPSEARAQQRQLWWH